MNQVIYNKKLEYKCTLTPPDPRLLYVGPYMLRDTSPLGTPVQIHTARLFVLCVLCILCLAACLAAICIMQCWTAFNAYCADSCVEHIVSILFFHHIF